MGDRDDTGQRAEAGRDASPWSTSLTPQRGRRAYGHALAFVLVGLVALPFVWWLGPTTLGDCSPRDPLGRFGVWAGRGAHVDGTTGGCVVPHAVTWVAIGVVTMTCLAAAIWSLRRH